jgi:hypothetical protein
MGLDVIGPEGNCSGPGSVKMSRVGLGRVAVVAGLVVVAAGCVDHELNARQFCTEHARLLSVERDADQLELSADELNDQEDAIEETMRDAEDGTRPVRLAARDLVEAYSELAGVVDDEGAEADEIEDAQVELLDARAEARDACRRVD